MEAINTHTRVIPLAHIEVILLRPNADEPGIGYWLIDGRTVLNVFANVAECDTAWRNIEEILRNKHFLRFHNNYVHVSSIKTLEKRCTEEFGVHVAFMFLTGREFLQRYDNESDRDRDLKRVTAILSALQDAQSSLSSSTVQ